MLLSWQPQRNVCAGAVQATVFPWQRKLGHVGILAAGSEVHKVRYRTCRIDVRTCCVQCILDLIVVRIVWGCLISGSIATLSRQVADVAVHNVRTRCSQVNLGLVSGSDTISSRSCLTLCRLHQRPRTQRSLGRSLATFEATMILQHAVLRNDIIASIESGVDWKWNHFQRSTGYVGETNLVAKAVAWVGVTRFCLLMFLL